MKALLFSAIALAVCGSASAAPASYDLDPEHTFPSFEADHLGISIWRGKFNHSSGKVTLDKAAGTGAVEVSIELASVDFGHDKLNEWAQGPELFDVAKFPTATYKGKLTAFKKGVPTKVVGELTLHGVTQPVELKINSFKCIDHPMLQRELCGADLFGVIQRDAFGLDVGKPYGFKMDVPLRIQVEALKTP